MLFLTKFLQHPSLLFRGQGPEVGLATNMFEIIICFQ
jgi:hypothetical protein